jgi:glucose/arabinose dehydrogenase
VVWAVVVAILAAACNAAGPSDLPRSSEALPTAVGEPPSSGESPDDGEPSSPPRTFDPARVKVALHAIARGLASPVGVTNAADGSDRLFVVEQAGRIRIVRDGALVARPFLDIRDRVSCCGERGLLGLAFPPGFGIDLDSFFVDYTDTKGNTVIASYSVDPADPDRADPGTERIILHIDQPYANHNGGGLAFGPDGDLYIGMGDGGSAGDPQGNGQRLDTLLGKLLRIDASSDPGGAQPYVIPDDNPFLDQPNRPEIWAYGLRNPWRFSFDRATGDLWIGDVGQGRYEEIDRAPVGTGAGANYGWNRMEGAHCYPGGDACDRSALVLPLAEVDHSKGDCAIIGGYVYGGVAFPMLSGAYLFGDNCSGIVRSLAADGPDRQAPVVLLESHTQISSFGEDEAGEMYLTDLGSGTLYEIRAVAR